jgi:hypothetical protein
LAHQVWTPKAPVWHLRNRDRNKEVTNCDILEITGCNLQPVISRHPRRGKGLGFFVLGGIIKKERALMKYISWFLTLLAWLALAGVILFIAGPLMTNSMCGPYRALAKYWLCIVVVLSAVPVINPRLKYDSWVQRFLAGSALVILPLLLFSSFLLGDYYNYLRLIIALGIIILFGGGMVFLCFFLKKKAKIEDEKTDKIFRNLFLRAIWLSAIVFGSFLFLSPVLSVPLICLLILATGIPAVINWGRARTPQFVFVYIAVILASICLLLAYFPVIYYGAGGE